MGITRFDIIKANGYIGLPEPCEAGQTGKVYYVSNSSVLPEGGIAGSNSNSGTSPLQPFATLAYAISRCTANRGDTIKVGAGHAETLSSASAIAANVAGISIEGMGQGAARPTFTFANTAATFVVSANNVSLKGIIGKPSVDSVVNAFVVTGDNCDLDIEWQDLSAAVEAINPVRLDTAHNCRCKLVHRGFTAGNATTSAIKLDACNNVLIDVDAYGICSVAWVDMVDTASTNVSVFGKMYTHGVTNYSRDVVDTVTGSTWFAELYDASFGGKVSGGSAAALAADDVSAVGTAVSAIKAVTDVLPDAGALTSLAQDATVAKEATLGTPVGADISTDIAAVQSDVTDIKAVTDVLPDAGALTSLAQDATVAKEATLGTPVGADLSADIAAVQSDVTAIKAVTDVDNGYARVVVKEIADMTGFDDAAMFTVVGDVFVKVIGVVGGTAITSTSGTTTLSVGTTEAPAGLLPASTIDNTQFAATDVWVDSSPSDDVEEANPNFAVVGGGAAINLVRSVDDITAGSLKLYCLWKPLSVGSSVTAA